MRKITLKKFNNFYNNSQLRTKNYILNYKVTCQLKIKNFNIMKRQIMKVLNLL